MILFFGDHLPGLSDDFYAELYGKPLSELTQEELQRKYASPFFIWANYDIEEQTVDAISLNYLSSLLFDTAGLPMTGYQQFLSELYLRYPVISAIGMIDSEGKHYERGASVDDAMLREYQYMEYNHIFDTDARCDDLFKLS